MRLVLLILFFSVSYIQSNDTCSECDDVWFDGYWGDQCCDSAWDQWGFDCNYMENEYGWNCAGCNCPNDENPICGDEFCNGNETIDNCSYDCTTNGCNTVNQIDDCSDNDCCPISWIGDGYADCEDPNNFGCDLSCYNNDGGDCPGENTGDLNTDGNTNILDIVLLVNIILGFEANNELADINADNTVDILDIITLVNIIIE